MSLRYIVYALLFFSFGCSNDDNLSEITDPDFDDFQIVKSLSLQNEEYSVFSGLILSFNYPIEKEISIGKNNVKYRAVFDRIESQDINFTKATFEWNNDQTEVLITPEFNLAPNTTIYFNAVVHWERLIEREWKKVSTNEVFIEKLSVEHLPLIIEKGNISENSTVSIFTIPTFSTKISLDTEIHGFKPFIDNAEILVDNEVFPVTFKIKDDRKTIEVIPEEAFLTESNQLQIKIKTSWKKEINGELYHVTDYSNKLTTKINFKSRFYDINTNFSPRNSDNKVSIYHTPRIEFDYGMNQSLTINSKIRPAYTLLQLKDSNSNVLSTNLVWDQDNKTVEFNTADNLPENETLTIIANLQWEIFEENEWKPLEPNYTKSHTITFHTNTALESELIDISKFIHSYPIPYQINFLKSETNQGYIFLDNLSQDVNELLQNFDSSNATVIFSNKSGYNISVPVLYTESDKNFTFSIPDALPNDSIITMELQLFDGHKDIVLTRFFFGTSHYNTLSEKIGSLTRISGWSRPLRDRVHELGQTYIEAKEVFDKVEIQELITIEAVLENDPYYNDIIYPLIYDGLKRGELNLSWRGNSIYDIIPINAMNIRQYPNDKELEYIDYLADRRPYIIDIGAFIYNLPDIYEKDFTDLKNQIKNIAVSQRSDWMNTLLNSQFPPIPKGDYDFVIKYTLPGTNQITSEVSLFVQKPL